MFTPKIECPNSLDVTPPSKKAKGFVDVSLVVLVCSEICLAGGSSSIGKLLVRFDAFGEEGGDSRELEIRGCCGQTPWKFDDSRLKLWGWFSPKKGRNR